MKNNIASKIAALSKQNRSKLYRVISFSIAVCIIMVLIPIVFLLIGKAVNRWISISCPRNIELLLAGISGAIGLLILLWSVWTQWSVGRGGPTPVAPTQKLITSGPYALCRNPFQLGDFFYMFAFGLVFGNMAIAVVCIVLESTLGVAYHKGIEEKELIIRFGDEYRHYKDRTPFLIPRFWKNAK